MNQENEWIIVKNHSKNAFNPNKLKLKHNNNKLTYEKIYTETKKTLQEIEFNLHKKIK